MGVRLAYLEASGEHPLLFLPVSLRCLWYVSGAKIPLTTILNNPIGRIPASGEPQEQADDGSMSDILYIFSPAQKKKIIGFPCGNNQRKSLYLSFAISFLLLLLAFTQFAYSFSRTNCYVIGSITSSQNNEDAVAVDNPAPISINQKAYTPKRSRPRISILHYSNHFVCVNKPCGTSVHSYKSQSRRYNGEFVVQSLLKKQLARKVYPIHRLDHRTSGALLFAFSSEQAARLHSALRHGNSTKQYIALLRGSWEHTFGNHSSVRVEKPLLVDGVMKDAVTLFTPVASLRQGEEDGSIIVHANNNTTTRHHTDNSALRHPRDCTLVLVEPKTGRTHQIRRHAYALGHPILGDTEHGDTKVNRWWREEHGLNRLALHCFCLDLFLEENGANKNEGDDRIEEENFQLNHQEEQRVKIIAPLLDDLSCVLSCTELQPLWKEAVRKYPRLAMEPYDFRGGTFGRRKKNMFSTNYVNVSDA